MKLYFIIILDLFLGTWFFVSLCIFQLSAGWGLFAEIPRHVKTRLSAANAIALRACYHQ